MVDTMVLTKKWHNKELEKEDIKQYLQENLSESLNVNTAREKRHLLKCLYDLYLAYHKGKHRLGSFLQAVVDNDLRSACYRADLINRRNLVIFVEFLYNVAPSDYGERLS